MVRVNDGGAVCLTQVQLVADNTFFDAGTTTPHFTPHKNQCKRIGVFYSPLLNAKILRLHWIRNTLII